LCHFKTDWASSQNHHSSGQRSDVEKSGVRVKGGITQSYHKHNKNSGLNKLIKLTKPGMSGMKAVPPVAITAFLSKKQSINQDI